MLTNFRRLELGGGVVSKTGLLGLPAITHGYADAQIDDYGRFPSRQNYPWKPGVELQLRARFSHGEDRLLGTAGFGFWNAPFGDPTLRWPALPQAVWFFFASPPTNLPLALPDQPGRGWFASTINAATPKALLTAPLAPFVLALNQVPALRRRIWPFIRPRLGISFAPITVDMTGWHSYRLVWRQTGCLFEVDGNPILHTPHSPRGPLGFVCWLDNQHLAVELNGRFSWGVIPTRQKQWLEIADLNLGSL